LKTLLSVNPAQCFREKNPAKTPLKEEKKQVKKLWCICASFIQT